MEQDVHWVRRNQSCLSSKRKNVAITPHDYAAYVGQMVLGCEIGAERILEHPDIERLKTEKQETIREAKEARSGSQEISRRGPETP